MSGLIQKSRIPRRSQSSLAPEVKEAIALAKNALRTNGPRTLFKNVKGGSRGDGPPLPGVPQGCKYFEFPVGTAHPDDPNPKGRRRLVLTVHSSGRILEIYYTENHFAKGTVVRAV